MTTTKTVTIVTANLGRGVPPSRFEENLDRLIKQTPGVHRFFQFQEIDEADDAEEMKMIRAKLHETHHFVGVKTHVPIAIPRTFKVDRRIINVASEGVDHLSPRRHVVQAVVHPKGHPTAKIVPTNTHFARDADALDKVRADADRVLRKRLDIALPAWMTGDLNSQFYKKLNEDELKLVEVRLDYIRGYPRAGVRMQCLKAGHIDLTIDGHNAHWARVKITWP